MIYDILSALFGSFLFGWCLSKGILIYQQFIGKAIGR